MFKGTLIFIKNFFRERSQIGSIIPSSAFLGRAVSEHVQHSENQSPLRILEVGPGVGPITSQVVKRLKPQDTLVLVELNAEFCKHLEKRIPQWKKEKENIHIELHNVSVFDFADPKPYDVIICSLPLNNFPIIFIKEIFKVFKSHLKPDGILSYYEYLGVRGLGKHIAPTPKMRRRFKDFNAFFEKDIRPKRVGRKEVWTNFPPALVNHLKL